jgi:hypothetical protein
MSHGASSYRNVLPREMVDAVRPGIQAPLVPAGQHWAAVSFVGNHEEHKYAMSILGVFETKDEVNVWVQKLRREGFVQFDIWPVPLNEFFCISPPPEPSVAVDVHYENPVLERIMNSHRNSIQTAESRVSKRVESFKKPNTQKTLEADEKYQ